MNSPEVLIHEWQRPRHLSAKMLPRPRLPYSVTIDGRALSGKDGSIVRFRNYESALEAAREEVKRLYRPTDELLAEARIALNTLELMTSKTWQGDPDYPRQLAGRLRDLSMMIVRNISNPA